jgi:hypothetical protein
LNLSLIEERKGKRRKKIDKTGRKRMEGFTRNATTKRNNRKEKVQ